MRELKKNSKSVLDSLPATSRQIVDKLGISCTSVASCLRHLMRHGLASRGDSINIPHGKHFIYMKTDKCEEIDDSNGAPRHIPSTTLTKWIGGNPFTRI